VTGDFALTPKQGGNMIRIATLALALTLGVFAHAAQAQTNDDREACEADFMKFCDGVDPSPGPAGKCLAKNRHKLSAACRKRLSKRD
jgi:hypothetical protein